ncbi:MAG: hypothetical protein JXB05_00795 [Myxococcaceae bacterium]|nr:hypothetical protein [Myxococcaceae bacterium]
MAHQQFVRGKFAQCAQTYHQILRLAPRDPNMRVRHAEACKRAGDRLQAIASYRAAAELLLELGCESRARGALKAALELDPRDPILQVDIARLGPHAPRYYGERDELPLLPPLESGMDSVPPPPPPAPRPVRVLRPEAFSRTPALPKIHRALPAAPSVPPLVPPVLLPAPNVTPTASGQPAAAAPRPTPQPPRSATTSHPSAPPPPPPSITPPPPQEAILEHDLGASLAQTAAAVAPEPAQEPRPRLEVRRLSSNAIAFRCSPTDGWALIRAHTPLELHVVDDLERLPPMMRDLAPEMTVGAAAEAASSSMH